MGGRAWEGLGRGWRGREMVVAARLEGEAFSACTRTEAVKTMTSHGPYRSASSSLCKKGRMRTCIVCDEPPKRKEKEKSSEVEGVTDAWTRVSSRSSTRVGHKHGDGADRLEREDGTELSSVTMPG